MILNRQSTKHSNIIVPLSKVTFILVNKRIKLNFPFDNVVTMLCGKYFDGTNKKKQEKYKIVLVLFL